jgi:hypothetical protein
MMEGCTSWPQIFTFIGANIVMFLWMVRESNQDRREFHALIRAIKDDISDFHSRLLLIEKEKDKH